MSTLFVNNLTTASGSSITLGSGKTLDASAGTLTPSAGYLIQRQSVKFNTAYTNSSTSFTDITPATITFTPKFASSLLLITFNYSLNVYASGTDTNAGGTIKLLHDGTALDYNASGNYEHYFQNDAGAGTGPNNYMRQVKFAEVAASNTNARVIKAQARCYNSTTAGVRINQATYYTSFLIIEELKQ